MAQRLLLRRHTRHSQVPLPIPFFALVRAQVLDTRRTALPDVQSYLFLVRSGAFAVLLPLSFMRLLLVVFGFSQGNFFISFFVLTNALEDPTILGGKGIELFNTILKYAYVGLLLTCFILSLGNRPQGSNKGYTLAFIGFAIFTVYMTVRVWFAC